MDTKQFKENLLLYGADINQWPEKIRQSGVKALESSPEYRALQEDHDSFEKMLKTRRFEELADNFAQRVISASLQQRQKAPFSLGSFIEDMISEFRISKPALAVLSFVTVLVLTIGLTVGFLYPSMTWVSNNAEETNLQAFLFDEGDVI